MVEVISSEEFKKEVFDYEANEQWAYEKNQPVIVNFSASWCGPCQSFAPVLEQISNEYQGKLRVLKLDIDNSPEVPALFGVRSVPTTLFIAPGNEPALALGVIGYDGMKRAIREQLAID